MWSAGGEVALVPALQVGTYVKRMAFNPRSESQTRGVADVLALDGLECSTSRWNVDFQRTQETLAVQMPLTMTVEVSPVMVCDAVCSVRRRHGSCIDQRDLLRNPNVFDR